MKFTSTGLLLLVCLASLGSCQGPPKITGSFRAFGEITHYHPEVPMLIKSVQIQFEENYDADTGDSEFSFKISGNVVMVLQNKRANQSFEIIRNKKTQSRTCAEVTAEEWTSSALSEFESLNGTIRFTMAELLALDDNLLKGSAAPSELRGIKATKYSYEFKKEEKEREITVEVNAYWSDPSSSWELPSSSGNSEPVPLGFSIARFIVDEKKESIKLHEQFVNVYAFLKDSVDKMVFKAREGIICPNRATTIKFPAIENYRAVSFHAEIVLPDYSEIKTVDGWFDTTNKLLRLNMDRIKDASVNDRKKGQKWVSEIISGTLGAVFRVTSAKGKAGCTVTPLKDYEFDVQDIINPKLSTWSLQGVFGLTDTNYVFIGKATKRNIPCYVFQGVRKDWPEASAGVTSLWEWCIAMHDDQSDDNVVFRDNELPIINLQISVLEGINKTATAYPTGFKLIHHFYDVKVENPASMDLINFNIKYCYEKDNRKDLQFALDVVVTDDNKAMIENATSDVNFLQTWKSEISNAAGLTLETLRVTSLESTVADNKWFVRFTLLGLHKDLPEASKKDQKSLAEAETSLKSAIDNSKLLIKYKPSDKSELLSLTATKNSLTEQVNKTFIDNLPTPGPPSPVTHPSSQEPTGSPITMVTDPNEATKPPPITTGHQPGTVAAVTIIMLLMGITIGSAGTFVKFNGLPVCFKKS